MCLFSVVVDCEVIIKWLKDGIELILNIIYVFLFGMSMVKIKSVLVVDFGNYICMVSNNVGIINVFMEMVVFG